MTRRRTQSPPNTSPSEYAWRRVTGSEIELVRRGMRTGVSVVAMAGEYWVLAGGRRHGLDPETPYADPDTARIAAQSLDMRREDERALRAAAPIDEVRREIGRLRRTLEVPRLEVDRPGGVTIRLSRRAAENLDASIAR